ncbi:Protein transport Sec1a [Smittium culicis]|uniref:Protein transport Sec1a n=1 Tax=Smittium culicis TaxID=133412 RepID=A0A1R1XR21_9FUNG|nr:Protein transport Sec1a [Smittium culicis]
MDLTTPLLHDFYYESMVMDLVEPEKIKKDLKKSIDEVSGNNVEFILQENDPVWNKFRYDHISDAMRGLAKDFKIFKSENKLFEKIQSRINSSIGIRKNGTDSLNTSESNLQQLVEAVSRLPDFNTSVGYYSLHIELMRYVMSIFNSQGIEDIANTKFHNKLFVKC